MKKAFKYLRIATAILLMIIVTWVFLRNIQAQSSAMLDGPLSSYISYTFAFNKITLASLLALVLVFDFKVVLPLWGKRCLRILGVASVILSLLGFASLTKEVLFNSQFRSNNLGLIYFEFYLFQLAYLLVSCVILSKSFEKSITSENLAGKPQ